MWSTLFSSRPQERSPTGSPPLSLRDRFAALRSLPLLFHLLWVTSPGMTVANVLLRLARAAVPLALLSIGKFIVNEVVRLRQVGGEPELTHLWALVAAECGVALLSDLLRRAIALLDKPARGSVLDSHLAARDGACRGARPRTF